VKLHRKEHRANLSTLREAEINRLVKIMDANDQVLYRALLGQHGN